jgi:type II secretory pathway component GspD/PulD (secretin)
MLQGGLPILGRWPCQSILPGYETKKRKETIQAVKITPTLIRSRSHFNTVGTVKLFHQKERSQVKRVAGLAWNWLKR